MKVVEHIGQEEKHYHLVLQLSQSLPKLSVKKLHGAHIKPKMFGKTIDIIKYIDCEDEEHKKNGVTAVLIDEEGEFKEQGGDRGFYSCENILSYKRMIDLPDFRMQNAWKILKLNQNSKISLSNWRKNIEVYWIQGPSAAGKSEKAEELLHTWYLDHGVENKDEMTFDELKYTKSGFYLGYDIEANNKVAIFDDFRARMPPEEFINLVDYRRHKLEIKGGHVVNNYELIIFTTVQKFNQLYGNVDDYERREQWERRITVIDLYKGKQPDNLSVTSNLSHDTACFYCKHNVINQCNCDFLNK